MFDAFAIEGRTAAMAGDGFDEDVVEVVENDFVIGRDEGWKSLTSFTDISESWRLIAGIEGGGVGRPLTFGLKTLLADPPDVCEATVGSGKILRIFSLSNEHKGDSSSAEPPRRVTRSSEFSSVSSLCSKA